MRLIHPRGQVALLSLSIAIVLFVLALVFAPAIKQFADDARNSTSDTQVGLDCSNASISSFDKANCVAVDTFNPYFIGFVMLFGGAVIAAKIYGGGG